MSTLHYVGPYVKVTVEMREVKHSRCKNPTQCPNSDAAFCPACGLETAERKYTQWEEFPSCSWMHFKEECNWKGGIFSNQMQTEEENSIDCKIFQKDNKFWKCFYLTPNRPAFGLQFGKWSSNQEKHFTLAEIPPLSALDDYKEEIDKLREVYGAENVELLVGGLVSF